ncbi:MAG: MBL fold metallo-hydrolase [Actinomycetota bacterium]
MELTVLGASGTWPAPGGATCGYLVQHEGTNLWLDAGTGTFAKLQEYIEVGEIAAIIVSHGHPDHFVDVVPCFYARHYGRMGDPALPFYSPEGFMELASLLVSEGGRNVMAEAFDFRTLRGGETFKVGPFSMEAFEMTHIGVRALGYRIEAGGKVLAYTGDTGPCDTAVELARGADLFLAEATYQDASNLMPFHMSASQAGDAATAAGAGRLMLTHLTPDLDPEVSRTEAAATFDGPVDIAVQGLRIEVGA